MISLANFLRKHSVTLTLIFVVLAGLLLRLYQLGGIPYGGLVDEINFGYIAYSLSETGADEHGKAWPLIFTAFGDQKLPGYAYALLPFVWLNGLSLEIVRLPSALLGSASILLVFLLVRSLGFSRWYGVLASAIVAFSPWTFFLSRIGFESNLGLTLWLVALVGLLMLPRLTSWWQFVLAGVAVALPWYAYIAYRPVTLVVLAGYLLALGFSKKVLVPKLLLVVAGFLISIFPLFLPGVSGANTARFEQIGITSDQGIVLYVNEQRTFCASKAPVWWCSLMWNKGTAIGKMLIDRYVSVFSPEFLATQGQIADKGVTVSGIGQFSLVLYPLFLLGLAVLFLPWISRTSSVSQHHRLLILFGLLVSPIPSILAERPQVVRLSVLLPFVVVTMVIGAKFLQEIFSHVPFKKRVALLGKELRISVVECGILFLLAGVFVVQSILYYSEFFLVYTQKNDIYFNSVVRTVMPVLEEYSQTHEVVIKPFFSDPIMYYAFYNSVHPAHYQQHVRLGELEPSGFQHAVGLDTVRTSEQPMIAVACEALVNQQPTVYLSNEQTPDDFRPLQRFYSQSGALVYAYLYDALKYGRAHALDCLDLPEAQRQQIFQDYQQELLSQAGKE